MPTIKDIAAMAGVSRGTVDRVLNDRGGVSPETAARIREIARAVSYAPNRAGKTLAVRKKQLRLGFILFGSTQSNPFFSDMVRGVEDKRESLREYGVSVELRYAQLDRPERQVELIDGLLALGIDGLAITPINHPLVAARLKALTATGFPVVTANSDIPDCGRMAYVGSHFYQSGQTAAGLLHLFGGEQVRVGVIIGSYMVLCHSERAAGFREHSARHYPGIQILDTARNNDDDLESYRVTRDMLLARPEINALYLAAAGVQGACRAVDELGLRGRLHIVAHDDTKPNCRLVEEGVILALIAQQAYTQGAQPLDLLMDWLGFGRAPEREFFYTEIEIKIRENLTNS